MTTLVDRAAPVPAPPVAPKRAPRWAPWGALAVLAVAVPLRFAAAGHLWLDEALSVDIARLPLARLPGALRHDGAPPAYYAALHVWMRLFGTGDAAVRALSGVAATAALVLAYRAGRRLGGDRVASASVLLLAASPFALSWATAARMYSFVILLGFAGYLVLANALERPTRGWLAGVAVVSALLLYTHYWSAYLLAAVSLVLLGRLRRTRPRSPERGAALRCLAAMTAGAVAFLPWVPVMAFQTRHTGTPWAKPAGFGALFSLVQEFSGGASLRARILTLVLYGLLGLGLFGRALDRGRIELDLRTRRRARVPGAVLLGAPTLGIASGLVTGTAFVARYTAVVFPVFVLLAALGVAAVAGVRAQAVVLGTACALGLAVAAVAATTPRTQAGQLATAIGARARPGDVVVYCPDQLGPSVSRLLRHRGLVQLTYPRLAPPARVDWVDYQQAVRAAPVGFFADAVSTRAGPDHDVWLVTGRGYRPFGSRCPALAGALGDLRPFGSTVVNASSHYFERAGLLRFPG